MAARYGIFTAGDHPYSNTATWSSTADGLTTPASTPTSADDILPSAIIANGSTLTVDTATQSCLSIDMSSVAAYQVTLAGAQALNVYGTIDITGMLLTMTGTLAIRAASGVTANVTIPQTKTGVLSFGNNVATTGIINFLTNLTATSTFAFVYGTINTNDKTITCGAVSESSAQARTYNWGNSIINCTGFAMTATNLTLGANTATINISGTGVLSGGAVNYNGASFVLTGSAHTVSGAFTCENLTRHATTHANTNTVTFTSGTTVTVVDTVTFDGGDRNTQLLVQSSTLGTAATIHATTWVATNTDFMDITADTHLPDFSAQTDVGDCGGNTDITFPAGDAQAWNNNAGGSWSGANWTGTVGNRIPLPQDDVSFPIAMQSAKTVTIDMSRIGKSVDFSGMSWAGTATVVAMGSELSLYGSLVCKTGMTRTGSFYWSFRGRSNYNITFAGVNLYGFRVFAPNGQVTPLDNMIEQSGAIFVNNGSFISAGKTLYAEYFSSVLNTVRTMNLANSTFYLTWASVGEKWRIANTGGLTYDFSGSTLILRNAAASAQSFLGANLTYNNVTVQGTGNYALTITENNIFNTFTVDRSQAAKTLIITDGSNQTMASFVCRTVGTTLATITGTGIAGYTLTMTGAGILHFDYLVVNYCTGAAANKWYYGQNSTMTSCTNWTAITYRYWVGNSGVTSAITNWSTASGGAGGASVPTSAVAVRFDVNSITLAAQTIAVDALFSFFHMGCSGLLNTPSLAFNADMQCYESLLLVIGMTHIASNWGIQFKGLGRTTFAKQFPHPIYIEGGANVTFLDAVDLTSAYSLQLWDGNTPDTTLNTNGQTVTCDVFEILGTIAYASYLTLGASVVNCRIFSLNSEGCEVDAGTSSIRASSTFQGYDGTYYEVQLNGENTLIAGVGSPTFTLTNFIANGIATRNNQLTVQVGTTLIISGVCSLIGNSTINRLLVHSSVLGTSATLDVSGAWTNTANVDFMDIDASPAVDLSAIPGLSGDCGRCLNITLTTPAPQTWTNAAGGLSSVAGNWTSRVPLPQDNSLFAIAMNSGATITFDMPRIGADIDMSGLTWAGVATAIVKANDIEFYGAFVLQTGISYSGNFSETFRSGSNTNLISAGNSLYHVILHMADSNVLDVQDDLIQSGPETLDLYEGVIDVNGGSNITAYGFVVYAGVGVPEVYMGEGTWTMTGSGTVWDMTELDVLSCDTSTLIFTNSTGTDIDVFFAGLTYYNVTFAGAGNYNSNILSSGTFNIFHIDASLSPKTLTFDATYTVNSFTRDAGTNLITLQGTTPRTPASWTVIKLGTGIVTVDHMVISDSAATPAPPTAAVWFAGSHSTDGGGNTGWIFADYSDLIVFTGSTRLTIREGTLSAQMQLGQRSTAEFQVEDVADALALEPGQPIVIFETGAVKIFGGVIYRLERIPMSPSSGMYHALSCIDWKYLADKRYAAASYALKSCGFIVNALVTNYLAAEGITVGEIQDGPTLTTCVINYARISDALDKLAEIAGFIWDIDEEKALYFMDRATYTAPWAVTEDDILVDSITDTEESPKYRNSQYKRGGKATTSLQTEQVYGDGLTRSFAMGYPLAQEPVSLTIVTPG